MDRGTQEGEGEAKGATAEDRSIGGIAETLFGGSDDSVGIGALGTIDDLDLAYPDVELIVCRLILPERAPSEGEEYEEPKEGKSRAKEWSMMVRALTPRWGCRGPHAWVTRPTHVWVGRGGHAWVADATHDRAMMRGYIEAVHRD